MLNVFPELGLFLSSGPQPTCSRVSFSCICFLQTSNHYVFFFNSHLFCLSFPFQTPCPHVFSTSFHLFFYLPFFEPSTARFMLSLKLFHHPFSLHVPKLSQHPLPQRPPLCFLRRHVMNYILF